MTKDEKLSLYRCIQRQFPDPGLYRVSRISEWLVTNGYSLEKLGYGSFREMAEDFPEMFEFQQDGNDVFVELKEWQAGESSMMNVTAAHPADSFFGSKNIILNDDIIEMSQQSLYALTKILGNGLSVQEMKQEIYARFNEAKENGKLNFIAEKYVFPIDCCEDGSLVNGIITKNISPRGKSLYFSFEKTQIRSFDAVSEPRKRIVHTQNISEEDKNFLYRLLTDNFDTGRQYHMAAISKLLTDNNIDKTKYGFFKMKDLLAQLDFLELEDVILGGVPQIMVTIRSRGGAAETDHVREMAAVSYKDEPIAERTETSDGVPAGRLDFFCNMPPKPMAILQKYIESMGIYSDFAEMRADLSDDFDKAHAEGKIRFYEQKMIFPTRYKKADGSPVELTLKPNGREGKPWFMYYVDTTVRGRSAQSVDPGKQLENFAFLGSWSSFLSELAEKAVDEEWDFQDSPRKNYQILIQYIKYTFSRLVNENKVCISSDDLFAAFNTGLVDDHYDDIYACFVPNDGGDTKWKFTGFCTAASGGLGKQLVNYFNPLPEPPAYFKRSEDLFFDLTKQLHPDFEHIIIDNIKRLPLQFLSDQFFDVPEARELVERIRSCEGRERTALYEQLKTLLHDNNRLFIRIKNRINDSIELAKKRVRWNYKTAIPSYFPRRNSMSLMLPLGLTDEETPDAALVVELTHSGSYQGQTILTLPQAYIDARLMCRLSSDWLSQSQIFVAHDAESQDFSAVDDEFSEID